MQFKIGQIINQKSREYTSAAIWCNNGNGVLTNLGNETSRIDAMPVPMQEELNATRVAEIDAELTTLDAKSARSLRAMAAGVGTEQDTLAITTIETKAAELRAERETLVPPQTFSL